MFRFGVVMLLVVAALAQDDLTCRRTRDCNKRFGRQAKLICIDRECVEQSDTRCNSNRYCKQFFTDDHKCIRNQCTFVDPNACGTNRYCRKLNGKNWFCNDGYCTEKVCGDGVCQASEDCESCAEDCGECPPADGIWVLGAAGEASCNVVCRDVDLPCTARRQRLVNTAQKVYRVLDEILGEAVTDAQLVSPPSDSDPSMDAGLANAGGSRSACEGTSTSSTIQRLCCCGNGRDCKIPREEADFEIP